MEEMRNYKPCEKCGRVFYAYVSQDICEPCKKSIEEYREMMKKSGLAMRVKEADRKNLSYGEYMARYYPPEERSCTYGIYMTYNLGDWMYKVRKENGFSLTEIANQLGIHNSLLSAYERNMKKCNKDMYNQIVHIYNKYVPYRLRYLVTYSEYEEMWRERNK